MALRVDIPLMKLRRKFGPALARQGGAALRLDDCPHGGEAAGKNSWSYWRPVYRFTWAMAQRSSYRHFRRVAAAGSLDVLDIGTGTGEYIRTISPHNRYVFTDIDQPSLEIAQRRAQQRFEPDRYRVVQCDAVSAAHRHPGRNLVSMIHVISVVPDPHALIEAAKASLADDGRIVVYISRFSKYSGWMCNPVFRALGFRMFDMRTMGPGWRREPAGLLNDCFIFEKRAAQ
jgi:SAM-dependent methyltransferase